MKKNCSIIIMLIGIILFGLGVFTKVPGTELTTFRSLAGEKEYSVIEEYVGGDAYNYIIGASLVSGKISGAMTTKAIYISAGLIIFCMGLRFYSITQEAVKIKIDQTEGKIDMN